MSLGKLKKRLRVVGIHFKEIFWQKPRIDELSKKYNIHDEKLEH